MCVLKLFVKSQGVQHIARTRSFTNLKQASRPITALDSQKTWRKSKDFSANQNAGFHSPGIRQAGHRNMHCRQESPRSRELTTTVSISRTHKMFSFRIAPSLSFTRQCCVWYQKLGNLVGYNYQSTDNYEIERRWSYRHYGTAKSIKMYIFQSLNSNFELVMFVGSTWNLTMF